MAILHQVTEGMLRQMAREASSMYMNQGVDLTDAVVKAASACGSPLTSEHVRRVCEMSYHDAFERSFRSAEGDNRVVSFDPPEASKVASIIRAAQVQSFQDKIAATAAVEEVEKMADYSWKPKAPPNAFSAMVGAIATNPAGRLQEGRALLTKTAEATKEAEHLLRLEIGTLKSAGLLAYQDLGKQVREEVVNNGASPERVLSACVSFMKEAGAPDVICEDVIADLAADMLRAGLELHAKRASLYDVAPNPSHPLCGKATKLASLRSQRLHREYALEEVLSGRDRVERELKSSLFS
jgi:hypothetical protein